MWSRGAAMMRQFTIGRSTSTSTSFRSISTTTTKPTTASTSLGFSDSKSLARCLRTAPFAFTSLATSASASPAVATASTPIRPPPPSSSSTSGATIIKPVLSDSGFANTPASGPCLLPRTSMTFTVLHQPGMLQRALSFFWKHDINITRLESRPHQRSRDFDFLVCFEGHSHTPNVEALLHDLETSGTCSNVHLMNSARVPWFPTRIQDVDEFANEILDAGADLQSDHPGFHDPVYRARRAELATIARNFKHGQEFPRINYTPEEIATWGIVWDKLFPLLNKYACKEHVRLIPDLIKYAGYGRNSIPQAADVSRFLKERTGFTVRPVAGLLSARHFLYGLAFRVFFSTQYLRHHSKPLYTPEPDIVHELLGHTPLFADPNFADFSQEIGLASIGASDEQITSLARCYWYSVEFGLCQEDGERKAYGAGLLSSFGELEYSMTDKPEIRPWDPFDACRHDYPITTYQPMYFLAQNFEDAKHQMVEYSRALAKPFYVRYNELNQTIEVDRDVKLDPPPSKKKS